MKGALLLLAGLLAGAAGCADNDLSMSILEMEAITHDNNCVVMSATSATLARPRGLLDVALVTQSGYIAAPLVRNNLQPQMSMLDVEHNSIQLEGANVTLEPPASAAGALSAEQQKFFYASAGGRIDPLMSAPMLVEVLPAASAKALAGSIPAGGLLTVTAHVSAVGTRSGDRIVAAPFDFPIDLCVNCLRVSAGPCPLPKGTTVVDEGCVPQQDDVPTCCTDSSGAVLCGAAAPIATM